MYAASISLNQDQTLNRSNFKFRGLSDVYISSGLFPSLSIRCSIKYGFANQVQSDHSGSVWSSVDGSIHPFRFDSTIHVRFGLLLMVWFIHSSSVRPSRFSLVFYRWFGSTIQVRFGLLLIVRFGHSANQIRFGNTLCSFLR